MVPINRLPLRSTVSQLLLAQVAARGTLCSPANRCATHLRCSSRSNAHPLLHFTRFEALACVSQCVRWAHSQMPRNKGTGPTRKKKPPVQQKAEVPDTTKMQDAASDDTASTPSSSTLPAEAPVELKPEPKRVVQAAFTAGHAFERAVGDAEDVSKDAAHAEAVYILEQRSIGATTRARGSAATREAALESENRILKARLSQAEEQLHAADAEAESSETILAMKDAECDALRSMVNKLELICAGLESGVGCGTHN